VSPAVELPVPAVYVVLAFVELSLNAQPVGSALDVPLDARVSKFWVYCVSRAVRLIGPPAWARGASEETTSARARVDARTRALCVFTTTLLPKTARDCEGLNDEDVTFRKRDRWRETELDTEGALRIDGRSQSFGIRRQWPQDGCRIEGDDPSDSAGSTIPEHPSVKGSYGNPCVRPP
jgi:hypothetical protein